MSFSKGPFHIWWQNLAHDEQWRKLDEQFSRLLRQHFPGEGEEFWEPRRKILFALHDALDGKLGPLWRHGRGTLHVFRNAAERAKWENKLGEFSAEWSIKLRQHSYGADFDIDMDADHLLGWSMRVPGLGLYLHFRPPWSWKKRLYKVLPTGYRRELGFRIHNGAIWLSLWCDSESWESRSDWRSPSSRFRQPVFHFDDFFLGKAKYSEEVLEETEGVLWFGEPHAEGVEHYEVKATRTLATWRRPRWPWPTRVMRVNIEIPGGIPIPGKGENGWDCEDDAWFSSLSPAETIAEAARKLVEDVKERRLKYGGEDWQPTKKGGARG